MDDKEGHLNRLSDFLHRLTTLEVLQSEGQKDVLELKEKLEALNVISEHLAKIDLKIESFTSSLVRLEEQDTNIEQSFQKTARIASNNANAIKANMKEIQSLYQRIDGTYQDINAKLDDLKATLSHDYLSNATFTRLQRNVLWAVLTFVGALAINVVLTLLEKS